MNYSRKMARNEEKKKQQEIKLLYGKEPKEKCPKCGKKTLFITNEKKHMMCVRCDKVVKI